MIRHFFWDFDGMLFDTYPHTVAAFCETYRRRGVEINPEEAMRLFKITMWDAFDFYGTDESTQREFYLLENDISLEPAGAPYKNIPEILAFIRENGGKNYLYTHRDRVALEYLDKYKLTPLFFDFVTGDMGFPHKPAPDAINYLLNKHSLKKEECMMLGDRSIDVGSGENAGIATCLFDEFSALPDVPCTHRLCSTDEIFTLIKNNFSEN